MIPTAGQSIPSFSGKNEKGEIVSNETLLGKKFILFFYPKDDSPGCTKEACSIRDNFSQIKKLGYEVYGVSPDKEKKHQKFIDKYEFQYSLIADTEKEIINSFNVWGPKKFMGREIVGVYRTTFLIDEKGVIQGVIDKVKTKDHGQQILDMIKGLESSKDLGVPTC